MADLKHIDEEILDKIKNIHKLVTQWSMMTKEAFEDKLIDETFYEETARPKNQIEGELSAIYKLVMKEEEVEAHIKKLQEEIRREFG